MTLKQRPIGIDLFAGAGGMSLGFEQAGFDIRAAIDIDPIHASVHKFNFPECEVIPRSVIGLSAEDIRDAAKLHVQQIDVVFGGAPCQGFSLIGQRALDDPRNALAREFVRITAELGANYFVFENVKGLTLGKHKRFLVEMAEAFDEFGYEVVLPWEVLNATHFGVPQNRQRLFLLGARKGLRLPDYPARLTASPRACEDSELPRGPTCLDALGDLPEAEEYSELIDGDAVLTDGWGEPSGYARELRCLSNDAWHFGYPRNWDRSVLTSSKRTNHTEISRGRFSETDPANVEPISRFFKLGADGLSNTLRAGTDAARGAFTSPRPIHYERDRCVTVREMARLHGFPDWFRFHETKWHGARQIGNSVAPPVARAVAVEIVRALDIRPRRPDRSLNLGSVDLLRLDMSKAANYWGIPVPIGKRDRKSGARKRKQGEIEAERMETASPAQDA